GEIGVDSIPDEGSEFWISLNLPKARDDIEDHPHPALLGRRVGLLEQHPLARQALQHQLESCGLQVQAFDSLEQMQQVIGAERQGSQLIDLAVLGVTRREIEPEQLSRYLAEIEALGCQCVVLCPTTEQAHYHDALPGGHTHTQLQGKPACTRKLQRVLLELVRPQLTYNEPEQPAPSRDARVLCVDDNPANLLLVKTLLDDMGADVIAVDNGPAALEAVKQHPFDLVLMDVQMPGMDGRQTTEAIRQWESTSGAAP